MSLQVSQRLTALLRDGVALAEASARTLEDCALRLEHEQAREPALQARRGARQALLRAERLRTLLRSRTDAA